MATLTAVHFGAGNIGRGFVGLILHNSGYEVVFADVNAELIDALAAADSYVVHEVGEKGRDWTVDRFRALNSRTAEADVVAELATADVATTAVGPSILKFIAPVIAAGLRARDADLPPLRVMACENAIGATDTLRGEISAILGDDERDAVLAKGVFANTAVDRIVPGQAHDAGLDVTVEDFFEWVIEQGPFGDDIPDIPEATFVDDLTPYIERKLFTVNTGHATLAYHGYTHGAETLADALEMPEVFAEVKAVLEETKALLVAKHDFTPEQQEAYLEKNLARFANPQLSDTVIRVGRAPLRKISRHERFVGPAAELSERGLPADALVRAIGSAVRFDVPDDPESVTLQELLRSDTETPELVRELTGLEPAHPLAPAVATVVAAARPHR
ncbi:mannitol-1-phosphate 5-dehydrogenase [Amnibacterium flavum]|uniref:Mannitol-1-phosphate 5-dehydrogenase n=1 Tax=Amnibacterium flavum TaxID=2173173 RepID=A0A2V1HR34_9MICO|nr:mannitol-1-phosphate 5-dehydrogenase [Amnibacterium flavum]PVZ95076.1 mannitol-1-phosphate 5-dehydrogenase [Amnibacterium flavum]